ncbi:MAG: two-component system OmpR family sensor kinase [Myxococcota bacterium]|jgi:two-component system OmpR family sensor kinase
MRRLYLQIYLAMIAALVTAFGAMALLFWVAGGPPRAGEMTVLRAITERLVDDLPDGDGLAAALSERGASLGLHVTMWGQDERILAAAGPPLSDLVADGFEEQATTRGGGAALLLRISDGRWVGARMAQPQSYGKGFFLGLLVIFGALALGALPVARRMTRRIERLQTSVDRWGDGDLGHRAAVCGRDEVAQLAERFNLAADRIEALVAQERRLLAHASHELRSPLARIRMGLELIADEATAADARERLKTELEGDIEELDGLVGDLLLASRIEAGAMQLQPASLDLNALVTAEAERTGASVEGQPIHLLGDPRLLRRAVRNLLENGRRHGGGTVTARLSQTQDATVIAVLDRGPGVAEDARERLFEAFYRPSGWAEGQGGGAGLGLSLVREIAELHGGEAAFRPRDGGGSCFTLTIPRP